MNYVKTNASGATINANSDVPQGVTITDIVVVRATEATEWTKSNLSTSQLGRDKYRACLMVRRGQAASFDAAMISLGYKSE